jgi:hypothetical protein
MRPYKKLLVLCSAVLGFATPWLAVAADDGAKIVADVCSQCHTPKRNPLDKLQLTKEQWSDALERMTGYGAEVPKGKIPELLDYLVRTYPISGTGAGAGNK